MTIDQRVWKRYSARLQKINAEAARLIEAWVNAHGLDDLDALADYAYGVATKYGEGAGALAAEMYDAIAELSDAGTEPAQAAETATYDDIRKTIFGVVKQSTNVTLISSAVGRLVKRAGADTMMQNASRDRAEYAWIAQGDNCPFCMAIAAEGWKRASRSGIDSHAEHIHGNCDCEFCVRFSPDTNIRGYDPDRYKAIFEDADGDTEEEKINALRRENYAENKDEINEQKRENYAARQEQEETNE